MDSSSSDKLWNRNFVRYWLGIALSALGDAFLMVALPFLVLEISGSASALATVVLLSTLPRFLGPVIGALADRLHLRLPLLVGSTVRSMLIASLALLALSDSLPIWMVYLAAPLNGLITSFIFAAGMVLVPNIVPRSELARANSVMQAALMGVPLLGLGVAGVIVGALGVAATILLAAPCFLALTISALTINFPEVAPATAGTSVLRDMREAARYLARSAPLAFLLVLSLFLNAALSVLNVTMPIVMERLGRGAAGYGLFESFLSGGILLGIVAVSLTARTLPPRYQISFALTFMAAGYGVLGAGSFGPYLAGAVLLGLGLGLSEVAAVTLLQLAVPDGMRGKVLGIIFTANATGLSLGAALAGLLVDRVSISPLHAASAIVVLSLAVAWTLLHMRTHDSLDRLIEARA